MARNFIQPGEILTLTAPYVRTAGQGAQVGSIFGVALSNVAESAAGEFRTTGVFDLTKKESQAWTVGAKIYWDNTEKECTTVATVGMLIGVAAEVVAGGADDVIGAVRLNGTAPSTAEGPQGAIVSLTDNTGASHNDTLVDGLTATAPATITNYAAVVNMTANVTKAEGEAVSAALALLEDEVTALRAVVAALVTDVTAQNDNDSDIAQKVLEILTALREAGTIASA